MEVLSTLENMESTIGDLKRTRCEQRFKIISDYKDAFGSNFDKLAFLNYSTGQNDVTGAMLRDAQTGCEIYEKLCWDGAEHNSEHFHKCGCKQFDEQLQFVSEKKVPLSNIDYRLTLADGRSVRGRTDSDGKTKRIKSATKAIAIEKAEFFVPDNIPRCPDRICDSGKSEEAIKTIEIEGIETNQEQVGSSVQTVTVKVKSRPLTAGEVAMARLVFKDSVNYSTVKIHNGEYLPFGFQDDNTAMTPNGGMYFNSDRFVHDFSIEDKYSKIWFMHEMTHIWQYQLGYSVTWHGFWITISGGYIGGRAYRIDPSETKDSPDKNKIFSNFNMEQQGRIIEEYFGATHLNDTRFLQNMPFYQRVLQEFIRNPKNARLLP
ncbi:hypothetical protein [Pelotalea chapellei]|uniref:Uncharacterized protein n=1 Tax=Pelotalea chapellei TaxID=44671 RepID=A0ABS5UAQ6_9BACT|nr:hypothetical protein [Pelotalea chapellei]MBT1072769.1 hypothetical protein [Pelotalea chapellei]